jgi:hypothetical protein
MVLFGSTRPLHREDVCTAPGRVSAETEVGVPGGLGGAEP